MKIISRKLLNKKMLILLYTAVICCVLLHPAAAAEEAPSLTILTVWDALPSTEDMLEFDFNLGADPAIRKEREGFLRGIREASGNIRIEEYMLSDNDRTKDLVSEFADLIIEKEPMLVVGASRDLSTMYAAMEMDFFEVPMLIPFIDGDIIPESDQGFIFRMTPTGNKYQDYISQSLLPKDMRSWIDAFLFDNKAVPDYAVNTAVFFSNDFSGHDSAVKITQQMMDNGMEIEYYVPYEEFYLYSTVESVMNSEGSTLRDMDVIFILGFDQDPMAQLESVLNLWDGVAYPPLFILLGYVPGIERTTVYEAQNVVAIRQKLDMKECPADIVNHEEALGYAAGYITKTVLDAATRIQPKEQKGIRLWFRSEDDKRQIHQRFIESYRNTIRSVLMEMNQKIPCYGEPNFRSRAEDKTILEIVRYTDMDHADVLPEGFVFNYLYEKLKAKFGITG